MPDFLPVRLQNLLYSRKPGLREQQPLVYKGGQSDSQDKEEADKKPLRSSRIVGGIFVAKHLENLPLAGFLGVCLHLSAG